MVDGGCDSSYYRKLKTEWWKQLGAILLATELAASHCNYSYILCRTTSGRSRGRPRGAPPSFLDQTEAQRAKKRFWRPAHIWRSVSATGYIIATFRCWSMWRTTHQDYLPWSHSRQQGKLLSRGLQKNYLRKSYICLLLKYPLLYQLRSHKVKKNFYLSGIVNGLKPEVISLIRQFSRDFIGRLSVKPWCHWVWRVYMWLVRFNCNLCLKCLPCGLTQKNKN